MIPMKRKFFEKLNLKHKIILLRVLIIVAYALIVTGGTYAYMQVGDSRNSLSGQGGCDEGILYQGTEIYHTNLSVTDNYLEGAKGTIELAKNPDCKMYNNASIILHIDSFLHVDPTSGSTTTADSNMLLNYKIMNGNTTVVQGTKSNVYPDSDLYLFDVSLTESPTTYIVYLWVEPNSNLEDRYFDNDEISGYLYAYSIQQSTFNAGAGGGAVD